MGALALAALQLYACDRAPPPVDGDHRGGSSSGSAVNLADDLSPLQTVRRVNELRRAGKLAKLESYVAADDRPAVLELLHAVDRLHAASAGLAAAARERFGAAGAVVFDRSAAVNAIGVFSRDVVAIEERVEGGAATVAIQVAGRVPLGSVRLLRERGGWVIKPDPPIAGMAGELRLLADTLADVARMIREQPLTLDQARRELEAREAAIGRRIAALTKAP
ncbi:MAG: hypothetical protein HY763_02105 [Planctomycetes bacterium]|nr:hypothetical protein [Planctomycetota bacterium]